MYVQKNAVESSSLCSRETQRNKKIFSFEFVIAQFKVYFSFPVLLVSGGFLKSCLYEKLV